MDGIKASELEPVSNPPRNQNLFAALLFARGNPQSEILVVSDL
jgi:hypothetical protein